MAEDVVGYGCWVGPWAIVGKLHRGSHFGIDGTVDTVDFGLAGGLFFYEASSESGDRVAFFPDFDFLQATVTAVAHALGMRARAVGLAFN